MPSPSGWPSSPMPTAVSKRGPAARERCRIPQPALLHHRNAAAPLALGRPHPAWWRRRRPRRNFPPTRSATLMWRAAAGLERASLRLRSAIPAARGHSRAQ
eukprot:743744-Prymnesium_polylepis.1